MPAMPAAPVEPVSTFHCSLHSSRYGSSAAVALSVSPATVGLNLHLYYHRSAVGRPVFFSSFSIYNYNCILSGRLLIRLQWKLWYRLFFFIVYSLLTSSYYFTQVQLLTPTYLYLLLYLLSSSVTDDYYNIKLLMYCSNSNILKQIGILPLPTLYTLYLFIFLATYCLPTGYILPTTQLHPTDTLSFFFLASTKYRSQLQTHF